MSDFKRTFIRHFFVSGSFTYATQITRFLATIVLSRLLLPEEYGIVGMIQVFTGFLVIFRNVGLSSVLIRNQDITEREYAVFHSFFIILGIIQALILALMASPLSLFYEKPQLIYPTIVLSVTFVLNGFIFTPYSILRKENQFKSLGIAEFLSSISGILLAIALAYSGFSYWSLVCQEILQLAILLLFLQRHRLVKIGFFQITDFVRLLKINKTIIINSFGFGVVNYCSRNFDNLLVGKMFGDGSLGIYNRGYSLIYLVNSLIAVILSRVALPSLSLFHNKKAELRNHISFVNRISLFCVIPISSIFILAPKEFVLLIWGQEWLDVSTVLYYFGILVLVQTPLTLFTDYLVLMNKEKLIFLLGITNSIFSIIGIIYGANFGYIGVAKFYTISNVLLILPFNLILVLIYAVKMDVKSILSEWVPIVLLSCCLALFELRFSTKLFILTLLLIYFVWMHKNELKNFYKTTVGIQKAK